MDIVVVPAVESPTSMQASPRKGFGLCGTGGGTTFPPPPPSAKRANRFMTLLTLIFKVESKVS